MISIRQSQNGNKDPVLHITITDHQSYTTGAANFHDVEEAIAKISLWIKKRAAESDGNKRSPLDNNMAQIKRHRTTRDF